MRTSPTVVAVLVGFAGSAASQPDLLITIDNVAGNDWTISAEYLSTFPGDLGQIWLDTRFELTGDGSPIVITHYNLAYDILGPAEIINGPTASFIGNANPFIGTPDPSNPLDVLGFEYNGTHDSLDLTLVGQNTFFSYGGGFAGFYRFYQDASGNPGELTWDVQYIPAPATLALAPLALITTRRHR